MGVRLNPHSTRRTSSSVPHSSSVPSPGMFRSSGGQYKSRVCGQVKTACSPQGMLIDCEATDSLSCGREAGASEISLYGETAASVTSIFSISGELFPIFVHPNDRRPSDPRIAAYRSVAKSAEGLCREDQLSLIYSLSKYWVNA